MVNQGAVSKVATGWVQCSVCNMSYWGSRTKTGSSCIVVVLVKFHKVLISFTNGAVAQGIQKLDANVSLEWCKVGNHHWLKDPIFAFDWQSDIHH